jgi:hypothetical protein
LFKPLISEENQDESIKDKQSCLKLIYDNSVIVDVGEAYFPPKFGAVAVGGP